MISRKPSLALRSIQNDLTFCCSKSFRFVVVKRLDMKITSRFYGREKDFQLLKDFVTSLMAEDMQHSYWHVGDLLWGIYKDTIFDPRQNVRLWETSKANYRVLHGSMRMK